MPSVRTHIYNLGICFNIINTRIDYEFYGWQGGENVYATDLMLTDYIERLSYTDLLQTGIRYMENTPNLRPSAYVLTGINIDYVARYVAYKVTYVGTRVPYMPRNLYDGLYDTRVEVFSIRTTISQTQLDLTARLQLPTSHACG